ncbi:hypothetical protein TWF281_006808 [Arthrobotrys megalospora]
MAIPQSCTVLVIGGGPAGSYAAAALAREGIKAVVLEADKFPRDTDFLAEQGPNGYAWNLIRSESDDLLFRHAGTCGAHIFDETKVEDIQFDTTTNGTTPGLSANNNGLPHPTRPVSASWIRKDGTSGSITFDYLVDASGRRGLLSTKYLKNRKFNDNFKNVASWAYWKTDRVYGSGTSAEGYPYFEALEDHSGWAWFMPLHDGTRSVGIVQDQKMTTEKKKKSLGRPSTSEFYHQCLQMAPRTKELLSDAEFLGEVRSASDWSYTASAYHIPNARICGDAGSFIDPLFSSGVHLAITGGLSAAATIAASIRGDCDEQTAGSWHSKKTVESYTRFFLAVSSATKQIRQQHQPIIQDMDEEGFQRAMDLFRPIIQGTADADDKGRLSKSEISKTLEFCFRAFAHIPPEKKDGILQKLKNLGLSSRNEAAGAARESLKDLRKHLTADELEVLEILRSRRMIRDDLFEMDSFALDTIDGYAPNSVRGRLGLVRCEQAKIDKIRVFTAEYLDGKAPGIREGSIYLPTSRVQFI